MTMLISRFSDKNISFTVGANAAPKYPNDTECCTVSSCFGYLYVGCFCGLDMRNNTVKELSGDAKPEDIYGFITGGDVRIDSNGRQIIPNCGVANVIRHSDIYRVAPLIIGDSENPSSRVIVWSIDNKQYPNGSIIFTDQDHNDKYKTIVIEGTLIELEDE